MDSRAASSFCAPLPLAAGVLPWEAIIARCQLTAPFYCQCDQPSSSGFLQANSILNAQIKPLTDSWLLSEKWMVPFVPLDNIVVIRQIQRQRIKWCFDFGSAQLQSLLYPHKRDLRKAMRMSHTSVCPRIQRGEEKLKQATFDTQKKLAHTPFNSLHNVF